MTMELIGTEKNGVGHRELNFYKLDFCVETSEDYKFRVF